MKHYYLIILLLFSYAVHGRSQIRINESFKDTSLKDAFTILHNNYNLKIAYSDNAIKDIEISVVINNHTVHETFSALLATSSLTFEQLEEDVIIIRKKQRKENNSHANYSIIGVVQDKKTQERMPHAYVWLKSEKKNLLTNKDGYFSITLSTMPSEIMVSYLGYQDTTIIIDENVINTRLYIDLNPNPVVLQEVLIAGSKNNYFQLDSYSSKIDFNPQVAYSMPSAGEIDLMRTIQLLPGINSTNEFSAGLSIQGGNTNQNLFLFDGFTIYHMDHFFGYFSAINPTAIKSVQLYKSGYDARYGGRASGVVDISGKEGNLTKTSGSLGINLLSVNTSLEVPLKKNKSSIFFSGRRSYTDILSTTLFERIFENFVTTLEEDTPSNPTTGGRGMDHHGNGNNDSGVSILEKDIKPEFYYSDLNLRFSSKVGLKNHLSFSFYDSNDILNYQQSIKSNIGDTLTVSENKLGLVNWGNIGTSFKWSRLWNESHYTNALISYSKYESNYDESGTTVSTDANNESTEGSSSVEQRNSIDDVTLRIDHEWSLSNNQMIRFGMHSSILGTEYLSATDNITFVEHIERNKLLNTLYGLGIFQPVQHLTLNLGLRSNYYSMNKQWYFEPRVSASHQATEKLRLKAAYGIYHQYINQSNTKNALQGSRDFWVLADDEAIPIQKARHITAGADYRLGDYTFNVEYFKKDFDGILEYAFSNGGLVTEFDNYEAMFFAGKGIADGIEFLVKKSGNSVNAWVGYTFGMIKYQFDELNEGNWYYADHDQRHEVNAYGSYKFGNFEVFGSWVYGSGMPNSQTTGTMSNQNEMDDFRSHVTVVDIEEKNGARLPAYHRLDIGGKYKHSFDEVDMTFALNIFNLYNRTNIIDYNYYLIMGGHSKGHGMSTPVVQSSAITSMGITPNISLTISF